MNQYSPIYTSALYRGFQNLDREAFRAMVHYYEKYENEIAQLDFYEYFDILLQYTTALLESEEYHKHLMMAEEVINTSMSQNVVTHNGEDVLLLMLQQKATSYHRLSENKKAVYILSESLKINPFSDETFALMRKCLWSDFPSYIQRAKAITVVSCLSSAIIIAIETIVVRSFYPEYASIFEKTRNSLFLFGIGTLALSYGVHFILSWKKGNQILFASKEKFLNS
jgi:hypothetical protein